MRARLCLAGPACYIVENLGRIGRPPLEFENNPKRNIALKLVVLARQLQQSFEHQVESAGVSSAKWRLIAIVTRHPGATQRLIADRLEVSEVTAGRLIDKLCADGYLRRTQHPEDRRAYCVHPTKAAAPLVESLEEAAALSENQAFAGFSDEDLARLEALLDDVAGNVAPSKPRAASNAAGLDDAPSAQR